MAFIKQVTLPTGETGDYWRIIEVNDHAGRGSVATGAGASVDDVITALQNLGLVKQS